MAEKVEELVETLAADRELMSTLMAVMRQSLQLSVDSRAVQPVQPVHEGLRGEFGTKTDEMQGPSELNQLTECPDTHGPKAAQPDSVR